MIPILLKRIVSSQLNHLIKDRTLSYSALVSAELVDADHEPRYHLDDEPHVLGRESYLPKKSHHVGRNAHHFHEHYRRSIQEPDTFWSEQATQHLHWFHPFSTARYIPPGNAVGEFSWFPDGKLNACYNCIDRHLPHKANDIAILWESDDGTESRALTYGELYLEVGRLANALKTLGVKKGDTVAIYMPMVPETAVAMLACARIGATHSVIFAGFSAEAVRERITNARCKVVLTSDESFRSGKTVPLKRTVDEALLACPLVHSVVVYRRTGANIPWHPLRDINFRDLMDRQRAICPVEIMDAEDPLFLLYTSGSTGKPKGVVHTTGGYLLHATLSHKIIFDISPGDVYACMADVGWITGHSYIVYGPLSNGVTTFMFEGIPTYPDASRYWKMVEKYRMTQFYTAPTALRALMKFGNDPVTKHDRSSLRVLGSVGEPINPEAWRWYYEVVGSKKCSMVDTYWQTETGGIMFSSIPGITPMKPGSGGVPFFGVEPAVGDVDSGRIVTEVDSRGQKHGVLLFKGSWPGQARTIHDDHKRYLETYFSQFPGYFFSGDGCTFDRDNFLWISGRVDDVINKAGHRLGTAEIESALTLYSECSEAAVIAIPDELKGQAIVAFCVLRQRALESPLTAIADLRTEVKHRIGGIAVPDIVVPLSGLPKTRSGKIMRRVLRKIALNEIHQLGDTSTLSDPEILGEIIRAYANANRSSH